MSEPFIGEIRIIAFNFAPRGWAFCNGQLLPINQNQALFSILGTTYGGDGRVTFALPDFRGRVPVHFGSGVTLGERGGEENHTLIIPELPAHSHTAIGDANPASVGSPAGATWAAQDLAPYGTTANTYLKNGSLANTGGSQPHNNLQPYLVLNFVIALFGIFPSRS